MLFALCVRKVIVVSGWVAPGFESVQQCFESNGELLGKGGGAYSAFVSGIPVVDIWAGSKRPGVAWDADTAAVIFSATKGLASLCAQILVDRGELDLDAPIGDYWPEFATNGKQSALVRHIPLHSLGVLGLPGHEHILSWHGDGWDDYDAIARALASATPRWVPGEKHAYHAVTFGWLIGEIVKRVSGVSIGTFFDKEVAQPLGLDIFIGTPAQRHDRVAKVYGLSADGLPKWLSAFHESTVEKSRDPREMYGEAFLGNGVTSGLEMLDGFFDKPEVLGAELPFGGASATARSLAKLFALLANGGELDGIRLVSQQSIEQFSKVQSNLPDELAKTLDLPFLLRGSLTKPVPRSLGFMGNAVNNPMMGDFFGPFASSRGVQGLGGQVAFFDAENAVAAAFVRSDPALIDTMHDKVTAELYRSLVARGALRAPLPKVGLGSQLARRVGSRLMTGIQRKASAVV